MGDALSRRRTQVIGPRAQVSYFPPPRCEMADDKERLLAAAISQIEKDHGKGAIMRLGSRDVLVPVSVIPSGCLSIDAALGVGGFPRGRVIEIYGPESGGKTTMTLHVIAEAQKLGGQAAFIDSEHALDPVYARKLGVDVDNLLVSQPDNGEQALEIAETLIRSGGADIVVVDSVAALVPKAELEGAAQADRHCLEVAHVLDFYQPDSRENWCDVRQPRDDYGWPRAEVLRLDACGHPAHTGH